MARQPRSAVGDEIYHVLNRGNCRMDLFNKPADYAAFLKLLEEGRQRLKMRILSYCLMRNHWHLALWPRRDGDLSRFMQWVTSTHVRRWREHRDSVGEGHLYQGRFKSFPVQDDRHLLTLLRYIEANPLRAGIVEQAEVWQWSSLGSKTTVDAVRIDLEPWPLRCPSDWLSMVNETIVESEISRLHRCIQRGQPYGTAPWMEVTAKRLRLESSLRDPWRPKNDGRQPRKPIRTKRVGHEGGHSTFVGK